MHQNNLLRDIFVFTNTMRLHFCISGGDRQSFHSDMIIVKRVFPYLFYHCKIKLLFSVDENPLGPYSDPLFKAAVNMEDKLPLNIDKFHLCVKLLLSCPDI